MGPANVAPSLGSISPAKLIVLTATIPSSGKPYDLIVFGVVFVLAVGGALWIKARR